MAVAGKHFALLPAWAIHRWTLSDPESRPSARYICTNMDRISVRHADDTGFPNQSRGGGKQNDEQRDYLSV
jgi:hypothetical protein